jgi:hypothetical protein
LDRSNMPFGIVRQNAIGSPKTRTSTPARRRCAAAERPYGPAPITATGVSFCMVRSVLFCPETSRADIVAGRVASRNH